MSAMGVKPSTGQQFNPRFFLDTFFNFTNTLEPKESLTDVDRYLSIKQSLTSRLKPSK